MDKSNKLNGCDYGYLCRLPIDKLLELLALAPSLSDKPEDEAYMDALEEAIIEKENENPTGFFPDVDQQWEQFVTYYLPDQKDTALEPERTEHAVSAQINRQSPTIPPKACRSVQTGMAHSPGCRYCNRLYVCRYGDGPGRRR